MLRWALIFHNQMRTYSAALALLLLAAASAALARNATSQPAGRLCLRSEVQRLRAGAREPIEIEIDVPGDLGATDLRRLYLSANVGTIGEPRFDRNGNLRARYHPPAAELPAVAILVASLALPAGAQHAVLRIELLGSVEVDVQTAPRARVTIAVEGRQFGPVRADSRGHATVRLQDVAPAAAGYTVEAETVEGTITRRYRRWDRPIWPAISIGPIVMPSALGANQVEFAVGAALVTGKPYPPGRVICTASWLAKLEPMRRSGELAVFRVRAPTRVDRGHRVSCLTWDGGSTSSWFALPAPPRVTRVAVLPAPVALVETWDVGLSLGPLVVDSGSLAPAVGLSLRRACERWAVAARLQWAGIGDHDARLDTPRGRTEARRRWWLLTAGLGLEANVAVGPLRWAGGAELGLLLSQAESTTEAAGEAEVATGGELALQPLIGGSTRLDLPAGRWVFELESRVGYGVPGVAGLGQQLFVIAALGARHRWAR